MQQKNPARIMIVDDDEGVRLLLQRTLTREGYEVIVAEDGLQALDLMAESVVDLLITDLNMPRLDGRRLLAAIRSSRAFENLPVLVLSGEAEAAKIIGQGADDCLPKPFSTADVSTRARQLLAAGHPPRPAE